MPKGYWVSAYHAVHDPEKLAAYAKLAAPAIEAGGGKFLARGNAVKAYEQGILQRTVIVEFLVSPSQPSATYSISRRR